MGAPKFKWAQDYWYVYITITARGVGATEESDRQFELLKVTQLYMWLFWWILFVAHFTQ